VSALSFALTIGALGLAAIAPGQQASSRTVLATISDARNRTIVDVGVDDFVVRENGQPREVLDVHIADYPVAVLIDNGSSAGSDFDVIKKAAARFITRIGQRPVALVALADPANILASFDDDRAIVMRRLDALALDRSAEGLAVQAIATGADAIRTIAPPFSAVVVIASTPADAATPVAGGTVTTIIDSGAIVHIVAKNGGGWSLAGGAPARVDVLRALAADTHGQFVTIYSQASYQAALDRLADRLSTEMLIQYIVPPGAPRSDDVKLGVRLPGARVNGLGVR
jgi:hypothetical protein